MSNSQAHGKGILTKPITTLYCLYLVGKLKGFTVLHNLLIQADEFDTYAGAIDGSGGGGRRVGQLGGEEGDT